MTLKNLASNWDLAVASGALLVIVGGMLAPRLRKLRASEEADHAPPAAPRRAPVRPAAQMIHA